MKVAGGVVGDVGRLVSEDLLGQVFEDGSEAFIRHAKEGKPTGMQKEFYPPKGDKKSVVANIYYHNDE